MAERVDSAERLIAAPPARLFAAWTDADVLVRWLPPDGATMEAVAHDPRPGGALRLILRFPPGTPGKSADATDVVTGRFAALDPPRAIDLDIAFDSTDPDFAGTMRMAWSFTPEGDATRVRVACTDVPTGIPPEDHAAGLASSLDNLARLTETP
ncbi:ATPase [Rhodobacterales bacterium HKCCE2091]|nr:ATPase [Rhodobacterales bacterium HKCCE2091]